MILVGLVALAAASQSPILYSAHQLLEAFLH